MKKIFLTITILMFLCTSAYALRIKRNTTVSIRTSNPKDSLLTSSTKLSTTGLTFSTTGKPKKKTKKATLRRFVAFNIDNLSYDIAKGYGEYMEAVAEIMEIPKGDKQKFYNSLKANFETIFPSDRTDYRYVISEINRISGQN